MPTLSGNVQQAGTGLSGFDINLVLSASQAQDFKSAGYDFCIRYIPRTAALAANNLTNAEASDILNAGLALMAVQHVALPGWAPTAALGTAYGSYAATYAGEVVGLPQGINIWCDLEEVANSTAAADVIAYCQAWYAAVSAGGYVPGIYIGWGIVLTDEQLYQDLSFQHYWRAYNGQPVATRGYQLIQRDAKPLNSVTADTDDNTFDPDVTQNDKLGGTALWLVAANDATS